MSSSNPEPPEKYAHREAALGGADAVEKTSYAGTAHGAEPGDAPEQNAAVTAQVGSGGGPGVFGWVAGLLALLALAAYAAGMFT